MTTAPFPDTAQVLAALCHRANGAQAEDFARRYVAEHGDDLEGWRVLLRAVDLNGNVAELVRLTLQASRRFRDERSFRNTHFVALVRAGRDDTAREGLRAQARCGLPLQHDEAVLLGQLEMAADPDAACRVFDALAHSAPGALAKLSALAARTLPAPSPQTRCIALLASAPWHAHVFASLADALSARGLPHVVVTQPWLLPLHRPSVVVLADPLPALLREIRATLPGIPLVNTAHGLFGTGKPYALYAAAACDFTVESSPATAATVAANALLPPERLWATGLPQTDALMRRLAGGPLPPPAQATVLFAPTFTPGLSAAELIGDDPVRALRGDDASVRVLLTAHPNLNGQAPALIAGWRASAAAADNVAFVDSQAEDIALRLPEVGVLVTDISSIALLFLPLARPIVQLFDVERAGATSAYCAALDDVSPLASHRVSTASALAAAVRHALDHGDAPARVAARAAHCDRLFGTLTDGRGGERLAERLVALRG